MVESTFIGFYMGDGFWVDRPIDFNDPQHDHRLSGIIPAIIMSYRDDAFELHVCVDGLLLLRINHLATALPDMSNPSLLETSVLWWRGRLDFANALQLLIESESRKCDESNDVDSNGAVDGRDLSSLLERWSRTLSDRQSRQKPTSQFPGEVAVEFPRTYQRASSLQEEKSCLAASSTSIGCRARASDGLPPDNRACGAISHSISSQPDVGSPAETPYGPRSCASTSERTGIGIPVESSCHGGKRNSFSSPIHTPRTLPDCRHCVRVRPWRAFGLSIAWNAAASSQSRAASALA